MSALLTQYFQRYAEEAITQMKDGVLAVSYYQRILARLLKHVAAGANMQRFSRSGNTDGFLAASTVFPAHPGLS